MSGGHFDYKQYDIDSIYQDIKQLILDNDSDEVNNWGDRKGRGYTNETILEFKRALEFLRLAQIYTQRIDWLVSGDDGEDSFHRRLASDLKEKNRV